MCNDLDYSNYADIGGDVDTGETIDFSADTEMPTELPEDSGYIELLDFEENSEPNEISDIQEDTEITETIFCDEDIEPTEILDFEEDSEFFESSDIMEDTDSNEVLELEENIEEEADTESVDCIGNLDENIDDSPNDGESSIENTNSDVSSVTDLSEINDYTDEPFEVQEDTDIDDDNSITYSDFDDSEEDIGSAKVLKRDPQELIESGNSAINDRLDIMEDQYRDEGLSDEEIADQLAKDRITFQQEFLNDAFPGEEISTDVFNQYNNIFPSDTSTDQNDVTPISDVNNWIGEINPNYDEFDYDSPYSNNCGSCAYAVHQRLEGDPDICATAENIGYNDQMEALTGMEQVSMSPEDIERRLLEEGEGAHAIIGIDRAEGAGHWFNAACINGKVVAIDGQTGEISDWPPDYGDVVNWEMSVKKGDK